ncbi:gamma-glutamylcyclotransferase, partial [bacterium]|nr:gamma-glutamylcyclotransferase [bacterium]
FPPAGSTLPCLERTNREEDEVWGILYDGRGKKFSSLERYLKVPMRYHRTQVVTVDRGGRRIPAFTYLLTLRDDVPSAPSPDYMRRFMDIAKERKLPDEWIEHLMSIETKARSG